MGATAGIAIPMAVSAGAQLFGAHAQQQTNQANLNAQQQNAQYMRGLVGQNMMQGQNPYASAMMGLMGGMQAPGQAGGPTYFGNYGMRQPQVMQSSMPAIQSPAAQFQPFGGGGFGGFPSPIGQPGMPIRSGPALPGFGAPAGGGSLLPSVTPRFAGGYGPSFSMSSPGGAAIPGFASQAPPLSRGAGLLGQLGNPAQGAMQPMPGALGTQFPTGAGPQMYNYQPSGPGLVDFQNILSGSNFNTGQDALMQMSRRQLMPSTDPSMSLGLQQQASGQAMFNNSPLFGALQNQFDYNTNQQVAALDARAGSLGQLAGTGFGNAEANLRAQLTNNQNVQLGQLASQSYESAQQRALQALGLQGQNLQNQNQFALGAAGQQLGAAQSYGSQALGGLQAGLGAQQFNAGQYQSQNQFNAAQGNQYNQLLMQMLGGANSMQMGQQSLNAQLMGILGGIGVPAQQPNPMYGAVGDVSQLAMLYPFLRQMQQGNPYSGGQNAMQNIANIPYNVLQGIGMGVGG